MTIPTALASFAVVAALLTIIPGMDTVLVLRTAISEGRLPAFAAAGGICTGTMVWGVAAAVGASALLAASEAAFLVLKLAGAAYMAWLGLSMLTKSFRRVPLASAPDLAPATAESRPQPRPASGRSSWLTGITCSLLNPKVGVFYMAMIPQFLPPDASPLLMGVLLPTVHSIEGILWFAGIIAATHFARRWLQSPVVGKVTDRIAGVVLIGFAAKIATDRG